MRTGQDLIAVFGATGSQGGATIHELLEAGHKVRAVTRKPESDAAKALAKRGAEVVKADLDDAASLEKALGGAWGVFAVQNTWEAGVEKEEEQGKRVAEVARRAGITHYVYTSVASAHRRTGIPHFDNKWRVEERVRELKFPSWVIVRPVFFMENLLGPWFKPGIDAGSLALGLNADTPLQMIAVADIGKYTKLAFEWHERLSGRAFDIAGDELTPVEAAAGLSAALGRTVTHVRVPIEDVRKGSEDYALMLEWFDRVGYDVHIKSNQKEFGVSPTPFTAWAKQKLGARAS